MDSIAINEESDLESDDSFTEDEDGNPVKNPRSLLNPPSLVYIPEEYVMRKLIMKASMINSVDEIMQ